MDRRAIGRKINELRVNKGLTQAQLAENLDISYKAISKWEVGGVVPDVEMLIKVADFFDISLEELLLINKDKNKNEKALIKKEKETIKTTSKAKKVNNKVENIDNNIKNINNHIENIDNSVKDVNNSIEKINNKVKVVNNDKVIKKSNNKKTNNTRKPSIDKENKIIDNNDIIDEKNKLINIILISVSLAMGICVLTLSILNEISNNSAILMLSLGLISLNICLLSKNKF